MEQVSTKQKRSFDWSVIKSEYLSNHTESYSSLALKYGISKTVIQRVGTREMWPKKRQDVVKKAEIQLIENEVRHRLQRTSAHATYYKETQEMASQSLQMLTKQKSIKPHELLALTKVMKLAIEGEREVLGLNQTPIRNETDKPIVYDIFGTAAPQ